MKVIHSDDAEWFWKPVDRRWSSPGSMPSWVRVYRGFVIRFFKYRSHTTLSTITIAIRNRRRKGG
jgi:hypothetical protein